MNEVKKLYKSSTNKMIAGVIGGCAEYFQIDANLLRIGYVIVAILTGVVPAIIAYIIAVIIIPEKPMVYHVDHTEKSPEPETKQEEKKTE